MKAVFFSKSKDYNLMKNIINFNYNLRVIFIMILSLLSFESRTQTIVKEFGKINTSIYIQDSVKLPIEAKSLLFGKIRRMSIDNGINIKSNGTRFIITASVNYISNEFIKSPTPISTIQILVKLTFGDSQTKKAFSQVKLILNGKGDSEKRSFIEAIKGINPKAKDIIVFMEDGKNEIIKHYSKNCDSILNDSRKLVDLNDFDQAIRILSNVPENCEVCSFKSLDTMIKIYNKKIDFDCKNKLDESKIIWSYSQTEVVANNVYNLLKSTNPLSRYQPEILELFKNIELKLKTKEKLIWQQKIKSYKENISIQIENIKQLEIPTNSKELNVNQNQISRNQKLDNFWIGMLNEIIANTIPTSQKNADFKTIVWE